MEKHRKHIIHRLGYSVEDAEDEAL